MSGRIPPKLAMVGRNITSFYHNFAERFFLNTRLGAALGADGWGPTRPQDHFCARSPPGGAFRYLLGGQRLKMP